MQLRAWGGPRRAVRRRHGGARAARWGALSLLVASTAARAVGQQAGTPVALRVQPRPGDTLRTRFEQDVVMTAVTKVRGVDTTLISRASLLVLARVVVERSDGAGCTLLVITDSVAALTVDQQALLPGEPSRRAMQDRRITLRIKPDGSAAAVDAPADLDENVGALVSASPAVLPPNPVAVGATWESAIAIGDTPGAVPGARLRATYRLDSLAAGSTRAYIGLRGLLTRDSTFAALPGGTSMAAAGTVTGALILDRARGWWSRSELVFVIRSVVIPAAGSAAPPVRVQTTVTQRIRTLENRGPQPPH